MLQEKQNNGINGLDDLTEIPGESSTDKSMLWQKLENRLEPKKRSKAIWYWAAAACLLIALSIPFINKKDKSVVPDVAIAPITPKTKSTLPVKINPEENHIITIHTAPVVDIKRGPAPLKKELSIPYRVLQEENKSAPETPVVQPENIAKANSPLLPDSNSIVKTAPVKLRVVHINDLDDEDRFANQKIRNSNPRNKKAANEAYTGVLNFNIHLNN